MSAEDAWFYCKLFTIGITRGIDEDLLKAMSSEPQQRGVSYFMAPDFDGLEEIRQNITYQVVSETCYTTKAPGSVCNDTFIDIAILVDGSGSICNDCPGCSTCPNYELVKEFVIGITQLLLISPDEARVALVLFSNEATVEFHFNRYDKSDDIEQAIRRIPFLNAATNTQAALRLARESVFNEANGDRLNRRNVVVILTDGNPTIQAENTIPEAKRLIDEHNPDVFVIGVTNQTNATLLRQMSSLPQIERQNWFTTPDFFGLKKLIQQVAEQACIDILYNGSLTTDSSTPSSPGTSPTISQSTLNHESTFPTTPSTPHIVSPTSLTSLSSQSSSSPGPSPSTSSPGPSPSTSSPGPSQSTSSPGPSPSTSSPGPSPSTSSLGPSPSTSSPGPSPSTSSPEPSPSTSSAGPSTSTSSPGPSPSTSSPGPSPSTSSPGPSPSTSSPGPSPSTSSAGPSSSTSSPGPSPSTSSPGPSPSTSSPGPSPSTSSPGPSPSTSSPGPSPSTSSPGPSPSTSSPGPSPSTSSPGPSPTSSPGPSSFTSFTSSPGPSPSTSIGPSPTISQSTFGHDSTSPTTPSTPHIVSPSSPGPTPLSSSLGSSPSSSSLTSSTTPITTPTIDRDCRESVDVVFIVDSSSSIYGANFDLMKNFVADVVNLMRVDSGSSRIGLVQFSTTVLEVFGLETFQTLDSMLPAIRSIRWLTGSTNTAEALEYVSTNMFNGQGGDRPDVRNIAVVITDGGSSDKQATFTAAHSSRSNMEILAIGMGDWVDKYELQALASDYYEATLLLVENYVDLASHVKPFKALLCNDVNECSSNPCQNNGQCIDDLNMFYCQCSFPYGGVMCENECSAAPEVAFLLDSSGSIGKQNFQRIVDFTKSVAKQLPLNGGSSVALATFSDSVATYLRVMDPQGVVNVMDALSIPYFVGKSTNTAAALEILDASLFQNDMIDRSNIAVLITDGYSNDAEATWKAAMAARNQGITLIVIGVGGSVRYSELRAIASTPQESNILQIKTFSQLMSNVDSLTGLLCAENECNANPCENGGECFSLPQGYRCDCTETYTGPRCERDCMGEIDIIVVLDCSGSIRPERFEAVKSYLVSLLSQFEIDNGKVRVGLVTFSNDAETIFYLDTYSKWQDISEAIMKVVYSGQRTNIASALLLARTDILQSSHGDRPDAQNFVLVFSDGQANINEERTIPEAISLRVGGSRLVTMSVGTQLAITNLMAMASSPARSNVITTNSFNTINDMISQVVDATCNDKNDCVGNICQNGGTCVDGYSQFVCVCPSGRTGEFCDRECSSRLDVAFVLDVSGSLYSVYALGIEFIRTVIQGLEFRFDRTRAGLVMYSDTASVRFYMDTYGDRSDILEALSIGAVGGRTNTQDALRLVDEQVFQSNRGDRSDVANIVILATDGESNVEKEKTLQRAQNLKDQGYEVYVVAIGKRIFMDEVNAMATDNSPSYVYRVLSTDDVDLEANALLNVIC